MANIGRHFRVTASRPLVRVEVSFVKLVPEESPTSVTEGFSVDFSQPATAGSTSDLDSCRSSEGSGEEILDASAERFGGNVSSSAHLSALDFAAIERELEAMGDIVCSIQAASVLAEPFEQARMSSG